VWLLSTVLPAEYVALSASYRFGGGGAVPGVARISRVSPGRSVAL
jgi:hypothetical protein